MTEEIQKELAQYKSKRSRQTFLNAFLVAGVIALTIGVLLLLGDRTQQQEDGVKRDAAISQFQSALKRICVESDQEIDELSPDVQDDCRRAVRNQPPEVVQEVLEGPEGPVGPEGPEGPLGPLGPEGPLGPMGPMGPRGPEGKEGDEGQDGGEGPEGPMGATGQQGDEGPMGPQGAEGPEGPQGQPGKDGAKGDPGKNAPTPKSAHFEENEDGQCVYVLVFSNDTEITADVPRLFCIGAR